MVETQNNTKISKKQLQGCIKFHVEQSTRDIFWYQTSYNMLTWYAVQTQ